MNHLIETSVPPLYRDWTLDQFVGPDNIDEIKKNVSQYLNDPTLDKNGNNLYLYSLENGTGKTSLAYYILGQIHAPRIKGGFIDLTSIVAVKFANYLKFCKDFTQESKDAKKQVELAPFLLLDDVSTWGRSDNLTKDNMEFILLMMYRREHLLSTIITSNLIPAEFNKTFGATISSKVLENFSYIEVIGGDVRTAIYQDKFEAVDEDEEACR
jgi:DNA replication protein DnaC